MIISLAIAVVLYIFIGGAMKFVDQAYDEGEWSLKGAFYLAIVLGLTMGLVAATDAFSTAFFWAMFVSLILARKVDNAAFLACSIVAIATFASVALLEGGVVFLPLAFLAFMVAGFVDEVADGYAHRKEMGPWIGVFLHYRPFSDLAAILLVIAGVFPVECLLLYFAFTLSYNLVERISPVDMGASIKGLLMRAVHLR
jgi:hypothetical protein